MLKNIARITLFPLTFASALYAAAWGSATGMSVDILLAFITVATVLIVFLGERLLPAYPEWNVPRGDVQTDLIHAAVSMLFLPQLLEIGLKAGILSLAVHLQGSAFDIWPHQWPVILQIALAMLVSQFFEYWAHRLMHTQPLLWRLHATHHSPGRLYWLNAARFHPIDTATSFSLSLGSLLILGANETVLLVLTVWTAVHGLFQHANIDVRLGPLNWIFSMAELHRWHHSKTLEEANNNYGNNILFWDIVFGTVYWPKDRRVDSDIGLSNMPWFPTDYIGQVLSPIQWQDPSAEPQEASSTG